MSLPSIALSTVGNGPGGRRWTAPGHLRIGRLTELEVCLDDPSVSRVHAEIELVDDGWVIRDRGSSNGTTVNGVRIGRTPQRVQEGDVVQVGAVRLQVDHLQERPPSVRIGGGRSVRVEAAAGWTWDGAAGAGPAEPVTRLMRAGLGLARAAHTDTALQELLGDALACFRARRCAVFLAGDGPGVLTLRAFTTAGGANRPPAKTLAAAALRRRQSLLFKDPTEAVGLQSESAIRGDVGSVVCSVLRAPDRDIGVLHLDRGRHQEPFTEADLYVADSVTAALALGLDRRQLVARHQTLFVQTVTALAQAVEMRDEYTGNHTHRVTAYALILAEELGVPAEERRQLQVSAALHDIGKIAIDDQILRKAGGLGPDEEEKMRTHVLRGAEIVQMIPGLGWALSVVRGHHERWDGRGYPDGLRGEAIPLPARVVAVADAFDAMTSDRSYRRGMPPDRAFAELQAGAGVQFDPRCVAAFARARARVEEALEREAAERGRAATSAETVSRRELERQLVADWVDCPVPAPRPEGDVAATAPPG